VEDRAQSVIETEDGFFIIGYNYILDIDEEGNLRYEKEYSDHDIGKLICQANDEGYIIIGPSDLIKLDKDGNNEYTEDLDTRLGSVSELIKVGQNYYYTGDGYDDGQYDYLIKIDERGNILWEKSFEDSAGETPRLVEQTDDGGILFSRRFGNSNDYSNYFGAELYKFDNSGNVEWNEIFEKTFFYTMAKTSDGGSILTGMTVLSETEYTAFLKKIDKNGNEDWTFENKNFSMAHHTRELKPGYYSIVTGGMLYHVSIDGDIPSNIENGDDIIDNSDNGKTNDTSQTPGFEFVLIIAVIGLFILFCKRKKY
jgi:hypothetical protein